MLVGMISITVICRGGRQMDVKEAIVQNHIMFGCQKCMLQQTAILTVKSICGFHASLAKVTDLAAAPRDDVMAAWAGLGYYARARNPHLTAQLSPMIMMVFS